MGKYKNFDECVSSVMREKKWKKERAQRYCGIIYWATEGRKKRKK